MREHEVFQSPHTIDVKATEQVAVPEPWRAALPGQEHIDVLRLCDGKGPAMPGWCTAVGELHGPEIEVMCGGVNTKQPTHAGLWRQGNLLHFGFQPSPSEFRDTGKKLLVNAIAYIARFTTDRPIVRKDLKADGTPAGPSVVWLEFALTSDKTKVEDLAAWFAAPWQQQLEGLDLAAARAFVSERRGALLTAGTKFTFDEDALALGVDVRKGDVSELQTDARDQDVLVHEDSVLRKLVDIVRGTVTVADRRDAPERARRLLLRLLPDGPGADTTPNNWHNWLKARERDFVFDPLSLVWRIDPISPPPTNLVGGPLRRQLRGPERADGGALTRDAAATALAAKVVARHGGARTLEDMQTFACRIGEVRCFWDRRSGIFRMENSGTIPAGNRATPWKVAIFDTAADVDLLRGGGPEPRPFVSARGQFRQLQQRVFLPLLLLQPGTSLASRDESQLMVHLAGRWADEKNLCTLHVDAPTGAVTGLHEGSFGGGSVMRWQVEGTIAVGPLQLPAKFTRVATAAAREVTLEITDAHWNPPVPDGLATSTEFLLGGK